MSRDATDLTFDDDVVARSHELPVVVDFWATWCGPCRQLTPVLEAAVEATGGAVELVKVDVDANPSAAARYGVRGIPAVKAFRDGRLVDEFTGAMPRDSVDLFLRRLLPSEADRLVEAGDEESLRRAAELEPNNPRVQGALARLDLARDADDPRAVAGLEAVAAGDHARGLELLLEALEHAQGPARDAIRRAMVGVFLELGQDHPLSLEYRRRLAAVLF